MTRTSRGWPAGGEGVDRSLLYISMALLLLTCVDAPPVQQLASLAWLGSLLALSIINLGGALGVYLFSTALHGTQRVRSLSALLEHPDNLGLIVILVALIAAILQRKPHSSGRSPMKYIVSFLLYGCFNLVIHGATDTATILVYSRMFVLPMLLFLLLFWSRFQRFEVTSLLLAVILIGNYSAFVSIFERIGSYELIFPRWIVDPQLNSWLITNRAGGILMQPAWNGLLMTFAFCSLLYGKRARLVPIRQMSVVLLSCLLLVGVFSTYTRAVWLAVLIVLFHFVWTYTASMAVRQRRSLMRLGLVMLLVSVSAGMFLVPGTRATERVGTVSTIAYRLDLWRIAVEMGLDNPFLGIGFNRYGVRAIDYYVEGLGGISREAVLYGGEGLSVHNMLLAILTELGIIGLFLYILVGFGIFRACFTSSRKVEGRNAANLVVAWMAVYFVTIQFAVAYEQTTNLIFYGVLGAIAGWAARGEIARISNGGRGRGFGSKEARQGVA